MVVRQTPSNVDRTSGREPKKRREPIERETREVSKHSATTRDSAFKLLCLRCGCWICVSTVDLLCSRQRPRPDPGASGRRSAPICSLLLYSILPAQTAWLLILCNTKVDGPTATGWPQPPPRPWERCIASVSKGPCAWIYDTNMKAGHHHDQDGVPVSALRITDRCRGAREACRL